MGHDGLISGSSGLDLSRPIPGFFAVDATEISHSAVLAGRLAVALDLLGATFLTGL